MRSRGKCSAPQPHFQIVRLRRACAHIAGAEQHFTIRQIQQLQHFFSMADQFFQRLHRVFRTNDLHHLDFIELVHTDQSARITAIGTRFGTEARRMGSEFNRQGLFLDDFVAHQLVSGTSAVGINA